MDRVADNWDEALRQQQIQSQQQQQMAVMQQRQAALNERRSRALNVLGGYAAVIDADQKQRQAMADMRNDTLSAMIIEARSNGGYIPASVLGATSRSLGKVITGGGFQNGQLVLSSPQDITDPKTGRRFRDDYAPFAVVDEVAQLGALQKSMLAPQIQSELWKGLILKGYTPNELQARGLVNPDGVQQVGQTAVFGNGGPQTAPVSARLGDNGWEATSNEMAMPGTRPRHGGISVFSTNGTNKRIGTAEEGFERQDFSEDHPANNRKDVWNQVSVGPSDTNNGGSDKSQVRVYENSKTGERVTVKDGENLRDVLAKYNVYSTSGRRGTLGLRDSGTRTSYGTVGTTAEDKLAYLREQEKLRRERELDVQKSRNDAKASTQKPNNMSDEMFNALVTVMQSPDAMKNKDIASLVSGIKAQYGIGDGSASRTGISGSLDEANKDGDRMTIDQFSKEEQDMIKNAPMPEGWIEGESSWNRVKEKDPLAVLRSLNVIGRQLDGGEQIIRYTDENGRVVETNGFRDKAGRLYGVRKGADGKNYRGDEIKDYGRQQDVGEGVSEEVGDAVQGKYGLRNDGKTYKGTGWLGELKTADGGVSTEYTVGVNIDGKETDIPTLVPTLTKDEIDLMVNDIIPNRKRVPDEIVQKAVDHARKMQSEGKSVFANDGASKDDKSLKSGNLKIDGVPQNLIDEFVKKHPNENLDDDDFEYSEEGRGMNGVSRLERFLFSKNPSYAKKFKDAIDAKRAANVDKTEADDEDAIQKEAEELGLSNEDIEIERAVKRGKRQEKKIGKRSMTKQDKDKFKTDLYDVVSSLP